MADESQLAKDVSHALNRPPDELRSWIHSCSDEQLDSFLTVSSAEKWHFRVAVSERVRRAEAAASRRSQTAAKDAEVKHAELRGDNRKVIRWAAATFFATVLFGAWSVWNEGCQPSPPQPESLPPAASRQGTIGTPSQAPAALPGALRPTNARAETPASAR